MKMNIATALNKKYLLYTGVMLQSLCMNNKMPIRAFLLHSELEDSDIQVLEDALHEFDIEIVPLKVKKELFSDRLPRNVQWSIETYYRLALLELLPMDVERLRYIDVDIIINKSLEELYTVEFEGDEVIGAEDACGKKSFDELGVNQKIMFASMYEQGFRYFNAGFLLFNIEEMRKKYSFETYQNAIEEWEYKMEAPDQDILNYVHWEKVGYINPYEYNLFARVGHNEGMTYEQVKKDVRVIHYPGAKPWDAENCHYDIEKLWWDYAKETPFYMQLLEEFLHKTMTDIRVEKYIEELLEQVTELQGQLRDSMALNEKFLAIIQGMKN